jgi:acetyl esterase/lipase
MTLSGFYLTLSILALLGALTALVQARRISYAVVPWFFMGWLVGELAPIHLAWQLLLTLLVAISGALESSQGQWGLGLFVLSWLMLLLVQRRAQDSAKVLQAALRSALGQDYRGDIPKPRQAVLREGIDSAQWLHPFRMGRDAVEVHRDIPYGDAGKRNLLDVYQPTHPREGGFPVLLQVHGGGWMIGEKEHQGLPLMNHLAERGWLCVACNYRLSPKAAFPAHIIDVKKALAWIRLHAGEYGGNPDFIAITGGSAGGHLSSLAALTPNKADWQPGFEDVDTSVNAAVPFYGVYDMLDRENIRGNMSMEDLLAEKVLQSRPVDDPQLWHDVSPINHVAADNPPLFVLQGTHDSLVWVEEARSFVAAARGASQQVVAYAELPGAQHAFEIFHSVRTDSTLNAVTDFLEWCYAQRAERS